jgi:hypothetical protein
VRPLDEQEIAAGRGHGNGSSSARSTMIYPPTRQKATRSSNNTMVHERTNAAQVPSMGGGQLRIPFPRILPGCSARGLEYHSEDVLRYGWPVARPPTSRRWWVPWWPSRSPPGIPPKPLQGSKGLNKTSTDVRAAGYQRTTTQYFCAHPWIDPCSSRPTPLHSTHPKSYIFKQLLLRKCTVQTFFAR